jgi:hypothetical protein
MLQALAGAVGAKLGTIMAATFSPVRCSCKSHVGTGNFRLAKFSHGLFKSDGSMPAREQAAFVLRLRNRRGRRIMSMAGP